MSVFATSGSWPTRFAAEDRCGVGYWKTRVPTNCLKNRQFVGSVAQTGYHGNDTLYFARDMPLKLKKKHDFYGSSQLNRQNRVGHFLGGAVGGGGNRTDSPRV